MNRIENKFFLESKNENFVNSDLDIYHSPPSKKTKLITISGGSENLDEKLKIFIQQKQQKEIFSSLLKIEIFLVRDCVCVKNLLILHH